MKVELSPGVRRWYAASILLVLSGSLSGCSGRPDATSIGLKQQALQGQRDASTDTSPASFENWLDRNGGAPTLVTDGTAPSDQPVMQVTRSAAGGDYFSAWGSVTAGNTYCVSANVRWVGGGIPFVGIDRDNGPSEGDWLIGAATYIDPVFGATTGVSATASGWQSLSHQFVMPAGTTQVRLTVELWWGQTKAGANEAYFDNVHIAAGSCSASSGADAGADTGSSATIWLDRNGVAPTLGTDGTAPSGKPGMQVTRSTASGDYFSPWTAVTGGNAYCVSANVRWVGGGIPFVGIDRENGPSEGDWLR